MHPHFTISSLLLIIAAFSIWFAAQRGSYLGFMGISMIAIIGLVFAAIGAAAGTCRPGPSPRF